MAKLYKTNGIVEVMEPVNGSDFSLDEMKAAVGGYIEVVPVSPFEMAVCDEEGLRKGKCLNAGVYNEYGAQFVGDVLIIKNNEIK